MPSRTNESFLTTTLSFLLPDSDLRVLLNKKKATAAGIWKSLVLALTTPEKMLMFKMEKHAGGFSIPL